MQQSPRLVAAAPLGALVQCFIAALPSRAPCRTPAHVEGGRLRQYQWSAQEWMRRFATANGAARKKGRGIGPALEREMREIGPSQAQLLQRGLQPGEPTHALVVDEHLRHLPHGGAALGVEGQAFGFIVDLDFFVGQ